MKMGEMKELKMRQCLAMKERGRIVKLNRNDVMKYRIGMTGRSEDKGWRVINVTGKRE